jgi:type VI protein secretion system component VasF
MPNHALLRLEPNTLAERLIRLLPTRSNPAAPATEPLADASAATRRPLVKYLVWIVLLGLLFVVAKFG